LSLLHLQKEKQILRPRTLYVLFLKKFHFK